MSDDELKHGEFYSSSADLNGDGNPEYFYYVDSIRFCGNMTGCSIEVYQYSNQELHELVEWGLPTFNKFDPDTSEYIGSEDHTPFICFFKVKGESWKRLRIKGLYEQKFNGKYYETQ